MSLGSATEVAGGTQDAASSGNAGASGGGVPSATSSSGGNAGTGGGNSAAGAKGGSGGHSDGLGTGERTPATASWRDTLPDELKADPTLGKYSDLTNLAKSHIELQKLVGKKGVFKPAPGASPEEVKAFRESLGIPTDASKYDMGAFDSGAKVPAETVEWAKKMGAEYGVEPAAMKALLTEYSKLEGTVTAAQAAARQKAWQANLDGLKKEWGDAYDRNMSRANFAAAKIVGKPVLDKLIQAGLHNDPDVIKAFSEASKLFRDDQLREEGIGAPQSPGEIESAIAQTRNQLMGLQKTDGLYPSVLARLESLYRQKTGGK